MQAEGLSRCSSCGRQAFKIPSPEHLLININSNCVASCLRQGLHAGQPYPCSTACDQEISPLKHVHP